MVPPAELVPEHPWFRKGDAGTLDFLEDGSVDLIVTSPPYWQRRNYGHGRQLGQEKTPERFIEKLITILDSWARLLPKHGSVILNLGDSYQDGFLVGIPARFEIAVREAGWNILNQIVWTKTIGMPEAKKYRLASRYEPVYHLTRARHATDVFVDMFGLSSEIGTSSNAGDVWRETAADNVWELHPARSRSNHLAPFPPELARRAIVMSCPEKVCTACGSPYRRKLAATADLDRNRPQARRALELFDQHGLTGDHLAAIRAVGISDAGKGRTLQKGSGQNAPHVRRLAEEAKKALGGYFREFTFAPKKQVGWNTCECGAGSRPGVVLDPFMGSGTTLRAARELGRCSIGVDLMPPDLI